MAHHASTRFWTLYGALPSEVQKLADEAFSLLLEDQAHPSLHFKKVGRFWSARVDYSYRALAVEVDDGLLWVWIGNHEDYERMIR